MNKYYQKLNRMEIGEIYEYGDWHGKCIAIFETKQGTVFVFLRYSNHHKAFSLEFFSQKVFNELNYKKTDWFTEELPTISKICICDWID